MKKSIIFILALATSFALFTGCSKKKGCTDPISVNYDPDAEKDDGTCEYAGSGGDVTLSLFPQHHGVAIVSSGTHPDSAFIKFNATNSPGTAGNLYDIVLAGDSGEEHVHVHNLKRGKYFIFMTGFDTTINQRVTGGIPYTITQTSGDIDINIPVTE